MRVVPEAPLRKALSKGCLWMGESEGNLEGAQDEASQQLTPQRQRCPTAKTYDEEFSKFRYL